jgi:hypothetical protein
MNARRRTALRRAMGHLAEATRLIEAAAAEERGAFDALPDSLQTDRKTRPPRPWRNRPKASPRSSTRSPARSRDLPGLSGAPREASP